MIIIGITGTIGSGKGTVVDYSVSKYGFAHYSARKFITEELSRRGLPETRDNMRVVANELRAEFGPSYVAEQLYNRALEADTNAVIESLRNPQEITALKEKDNKFYMLAVDSDPKVRYDRIINRNSSTDNINFEKFLADEQIEMANPDPNGQKIMECINIADYKIDNSSSIEALQTQVDSIMSKLLY
jgi:dephospho-CoA kinase